MKNVVSFVHGVFDTLLVLWSICMTIAAWAGYECWMDVKKNKEWNETYSRNEQRNS